MSLTLGRQLFTLWCTPYHTPHTNTIKQDSSFPLQGSWLGLGKGPTSCPPHFLGSSSVSGAPHCQDILVPFLLYEPTFIKGPNTCHGPQGSERTLSLCLGSPSFEKSMFCLLLIPFSSPMTPTCKIPDTRFSNENTWFLLPNNYI